MWASQGPWGKVSGPETQSLGKGVGYIHPWGEASSQHLLPVQVATHQAPDSRCSQQHKPLCVHHLRAAGGWMRKSCWQVNVSGTLCKGLQLDSRGNTYAHHPSWTPRTPADQVAWRPVAGTPTGVSRKDPTGLQAPPQGQFAVGNSEKLSPSPALSLSTPWAVTPLSQTSHGLPLVSARTTKSTEVMDSH